MPVPCSVELASLQGEFPSTKRVADLTPVDIGQNLTYICLVCPGDSENEPPPNII